MSEDYNRRTFLSFSGAVGLALILNPLDAFAKKQKNRQRKQPRKKAAPPVTSPQLPPTYDVSYSWHNNLDDALDYMEEVRTVLWDGLGEELGNLAQRKIRIVRSQQTGRYGVIYNMNSEDKELCRAIASDHSSILKESILNDGKESKESNEGKEAPAECIVDTGYHFLYNVCYGLGKNFEELKRAYRTVSIMLGEGVTRDLVIEKTFGGNYALVYKRYGTLESTARIAEHHAKLLAEKGITSTQRLENNDEVVFGESSMLDEENGYQGYDEHKKEIEAKQHKASAGSSATNMDSGISKIETNQAKAKATKTERSLEAMISKYIALLRKRAILKPDEKTAFVVYDLTSNEKLVSINEDEPMQAASMIKPFVALAFFHKASKDGKDEHGKLEYGPKSRAHMEAMIQKSSNLSTNWIIQQVGGPEEVQRILLENYSDIFKQTSVVEYIPAGGRTYLNKASAHDYSRFMYALWHNELPNSNEIKRLMALPNRDRIYTGASHVPEGTLVYDKTGSTSQCCGNFGILVARKNNHLLPGRFPYIIVGIIEKPSGADSYNSWIKSRGNIIREVSNMAHDEMSYRYKL